MRCLIIETKDFKSSRVLFIYSKLLHSQRVNKKELSMIFNVNQKTIQRDIEDIRTYINENIEYIGRKEVVYSKSKESYIMIGKDPTLTKEFILVIIKILQESRAFTIEEINGLIGALLSKLENDDRKIVTYLIRNELFNYVPVSHKNELTMKIWALSDIISKKEIIEIYYKRMDGSKGKRKIKPVSVLFSEYYFYLIAYYKDFETPTVYRVDRIEEFSKVGEKFYIPNSRRFEDGEFRKRVQFMFSGKLQRIRFEYTGPSIEAILDRLPTAKVISEDESKYIVDAEVYGDGIIMWILSQGENIRVIAPETVVSKLKEKIILMGKIYLN